MPVGRFQVMAVLQAARAHALGLPIESAQSWGLNRAIFYAAAKRGFKGHGAGSPDKVGDHPSGGQMSLGTYEYYLGDELAHKDVSSSPNKPIFEIGGKSQTGRDFERQIKARFGDSYGEAWKDALDYVEHFDKGVLELQNRFFSDVYRPKRDEFAAKWSEIASASAGPGVSCLMSRDGVAHRTIHNQSYDFRNVPPLMAKMTTDKRNDLKGSDFACPIDRKLPINDAAHVRNAMVRFDQTKSKFCHPATARRRILAAAKRFGVDASEFQKVKHFKSTTEEG